MSSRVRLVDTSHAHKMRVDNPRQYVRGKYDKRVQRTAWQLHCAYNRNSTRASSIQRELVVLLRAQGVEPTLVVHPCPVCGAQGDITSGSVGQTKAGAL